MMNFKAFWLLAAIAGAPGDPAEEPEAWKQKREAAGKACEAGSYATAEVLLLEIVGEAEKLGPGNVRLATPLEMLAGFYLRGKRHAEAEPLIRRALAIREEAQGPRHPDVAMTLLRLAESQLMATKKQATDAGPMLRRALSIVEEARGRDDPDFAKVLHVMGMWHMVRGEAGEAESALSRALAIREKSPGLGNAKVADVLDDLGDLHTAQAGTLDLEEIRAEIEDGPEAESRSDRHGREAEAFYGRALAIRERALPPDDPDIADSLFNLCQLATIRERPAEGERHGLRWLDLQGRAKAPASERQAKVWMMLAGASTGRKDWAEAERRLSRAQAVLKESKGGESEEVAVMLCLRADVASNAGRFEDAERLLKEGLEVQAARIGPDDPVVALARARTAGRFQDRAEDRRAPATWHELRTLGDQADRKGHVTLGAILKGYADLLRRTNRVVPPPTEGDLAYLKGIGAVLPTETLDRLAEVDLLFVDGPGEEGLVHVARLYNLERLDLGGKAITDEGLARLAGLVNLRVLDLSGTNITDAGLEHLKGMEDLRSLNVRSTRVTPGAVDRLRRARPGLEIRSSIDKAGHPALPPDFLLPPEVPEGPAPLIPLNYR